MTRLKPLLISALVVIVTLTAWAFQSRPQGRFFVGAVGQQIIADGHSTLVLTITPVARKLRPDTFKLAVLDGDKRATIERTTFDGSRIELHIRPGILPGKIALQIAAEGFAAQRVELETSLQTSDAWDDGTPDFLRLSPADEQAFRDWFTYLAESQYYRSADRRPKEINDCAALIRYAFREAFRDHDARWANEVDLDEAISFSPIGKYRYPETPIGAALFRIRPGRFQTANLTDGTFAEFADAHTLQQFNTHFVSRDIRAAKPGDLLFYRQFDQDMPFHTMVFIGRSHFDPDSAPRVVYHTGPIGNSGGEVRRPSVQTLLDHPQPKWRPVRQNGNFLGVYRWNILR